MHQYAITTWKNPSDTPPLDQTTITYDEREAARLAERAERDGVKYTFKRRVINFGPWEECVLV